MLTTAHCRSIYFIFSSQLDRGLKELFLLPCTQSVWSCIDGLFTKLFDIQPTPFSSLEPLQALQAQCFNTGPCGGHIIYGLASSQSQSGKTVTKTPHHRSPSITGKHGAKFDPGTSQIRLRRLHTIHESSYQTRGWRVYMIARSSMMTVASDVKASYNGITSNWKTHEAFQTLLSHWVSWQSYPNRQSQRNSVNFRFSHSQLIFMALFTHRMSERLEAQEDRGRGPK